MPLEPVLRDNLNKQYNAERLNAVFYKACEARLGNLGFRGFAAWLHRASKDERQHAQAFFDYLVDRAETPALAALPAYTPPVVTLQNAAAVLFGEALKKEQQNTQAINFIYQLGEEVKDPQTCIFLHPFIAEQTNSEATLQDIVSQLKLIADDASALRALDHRLRKHNHV